jgi:hypothetical protein
MINAVYGKPHKARREATERGIFTKYNPLCDFYLGVYSLGVA